MERRYADEKNAKNIDKIKLPRGQLFNISKYALEENVISTQKTKELTKIKK